MTIEHIVLGAGGPVGLVSYGILRELTENNFIKYENIKSIYATSIGTFIGLIYILNIEWDWIDDYLIKRPWEQLLNFTSNDYLNIINTKGLLDENFFIEFIKPLLLTKDLSINITLKELYDLTNIEFHLFTSNLNKFDKVDLNYKTYPDLELYKALMMSSSIPIFIQPPYYNNEFYLDGAIFTANPVNECLLNEKCDKDKILALINDKKNIIDYRTNFVRDENDDNIIFNTNINENMNILQFILYMLKIFFNNVTHIVTGVEKVENTINIALTQTSVDLAYWRHVLTQEEERLNLINAGVDQAKKFMEKNKEEKNNEETNNLENTDKDI
tara:strand:+ start:1017 stop:2003 length:987 start_codon:yes stop_codon:yes gene_type:complete